MAAIEYVALQLSKRLQIVKKKTMISCPKTLLRDAVNGILVRQLFYNTAKFSSLMSLYTGI